MIFVLVTCLSVVYFSNHRIEYDLYEFDLDYLCFTKIRNNEQKGLAMAILKNFEFSMPCLNNFMCGSSDQR